MSKYFLLPILALAIFAVDLYAQHTVEIGGGISYPRIYGKGHLGWHAQLDWSFRIGRHLFFSSLIGMDEIRVNSRSLPYQLYKTGIGLKHSLTDPVSVRIGVNAALVDDIGEQSVDAYPTLSFHYDLPISEKHALSTWLRGDFTGVVLSGRNNVFIPAFGVAYQFR